MCIDLKFSSFLKYIIEEYEIGKMILVFVSYEKVILFKECWFNIRRGFNVIKYDYRVRLYM